MNQMTPEKIRQFFEQAAKSNMDALKVQAGFIDGFVKRNTNCFTSLAKERMTSFKEISTSKPLNQALEANLSFEESVREELSRLQEDHTMAWEGLMTNLKTIYTPATEAAKKATLKKDVPEKAAVSKATTRKAKAENAKAGKIPPKKAIAKKAATEKAATSKPAPKNTVTKEVPAKKNLANKAA